MVFVLGEEEMPLILGTPDAVSYWTETQPYQAVDNFKTHFMGKTDGKMFMFIVLFLSITRYYFAPAVTKS